ncbi:hypothetical protein PR048_006890 [Dryococelus australis]|uniref:Uncharacterized protein n=1 Tax=Dryococelus australis TaxID=614101 RepID=A0ABQ9ICS2_9NEOP|nr:hypothetical protein PR048_006890 [Dryococelus australis]
MSSHPNDLAPLIPDHFLAMNQLVALIQYIHQDFWKQWHIDISKYYVSKRSGPIQQHSLKLVSLLFRNLDDVLVSVFSEILMCV